MYHSDWRALLAFSTGAEHAKCTAQFHICPPPNINTNNTLFEKSWFRVKNKPTRTKNKKTVLRKSLL